MRRAYTLIALVLAASISNAYAQTCNCDRSGMASASALYDNTYKAQTSQGTAGSPIIGSSGSSGGGFGGSSSGGGLGGLLSGFSGGSLGDMSWTQMAALGSGAVGLYGAVTGNKTLATVGGLGAAGFGLASTDMGKNMLNGDFSQFSLGKAAGLANIAGSLTGNTTISRLGSAAGNLEKYNAMGNNIVRVTTSQSSSADRALANSQTAAGYEDSAAQSYAYNNANSAEANNLGSAAFESGEGYSPAGSGIGAEENHLGSAAFESGEGYSAAGSFGQSSSSTASDSVTTYKSSASTAPQSIAEIQRKFPSLSVEEIQSMQKAAEKRSDYEAGIALYKSREPEREAERAAIQARSAARKAAAAAALMPPVSTSPVVAPPDFF